MPDVDRKRLLTPLLYTSWEIVSGIGLLVDKLLLVQYPETAGGAQCQEGNCLLKGFASSSERHRSLERKEGTCQCD